MAHSSFRRAGERRSSARRTTNPLRAARSCGGRPSVPRGTRAPQSYPGFLRGLALLGGLGLLGGLSLLAVPDTAVAQDDAAVGSGDVAAAANAFERAQQAALREDWRTAANLYALADQILPSAVALRSAARAALEAGLNATAATHAEALLARDPDDEESRSVAEEILAATAARLGRIQIACSAECRILVQGRLATATAATRHVIYTGEGERSLAATFEEGQSAPQTVTIAAGDRLEISFAPPEPEPAPEPAVAPEPELGPTAGPATDDGGGGGISPGFFIASAAVTLVAGAVLIWSGLDVLDAHSTYDRAAPDAMAQYEHGQSLELRTNVLVGVTSGLAVLSVVLAIFTDWGGGGEASTAARVQPTFALDAGGAHLGVRGAF